METKYFENFEKALLKLKQFSSLYDGSEIHMAAIIQAFEYTFEQCWKALQKKSSEEGVTVASPKKALEWAMSAKLINQKSEHIWIQMLGDRNLSSHTYQENIAKNVSGNVRSLYIAEFEGALLAMKD